MQKIEVFWAVLRQFISSAVEETTFNGRIDLTDLLFFGIQRSELILMSYGAGGSEVIQSMKLSMDEAKQIFLSIEQACAVQNVVSVKVGELSWMTDARPKSNSDKVVIVFDGPLGYTRAVAQRKDVVAAVAKFADRFGR
ncbi:MULTISPECIES: hypothetical protein [unclassified Bradyrhizobium]|uniref:hypothetical protein n=1 Tax=unclassified Bradyrhizobium TaxID=2631580 RepID=UPI0028EE88B4|nr:MULTISPECIES: hypothetical protein [unclassified Bradyrhizobium]